MHNTKRPIAILLVLCFLLSVLPVSALAVSISTKPENGTTEGQPFAPGTGGSQNFRIPGIVTLDDGTLIAACDARWNHAGDGAGLDTIVSVSTDNGETWEYTFANYLGDNGDTYNNLSTCFIDPGIATDGTTAYLIADLWPAGIALNTSKYQPVAGENGFDDNGNLLLRALAEDTTPIGWSGYNTMAADVSRYTYYLDLQTLTLHNADGSEIEGYTVDAFFNITGNGVNTNLFFSDSPYQPYPTDYLYMTTSTDGLTWSEPELLNLKEESEQTLLVGPGNGTYHAANGHMIFTAYEHSSGYERTSLIWMDEAGNWSRSEDATGYSNWSSEASAVVLADGTVRVFYRDGHAVLRYTDYVFDETVNNYVVSAYEVSTTAAKDVGCQLTAIKYSEQIDGKDVILVATPTTSRRINGYIYAFLVGEDNSMELAYAYNVTPDFYAYSCLTELEDGRIGLLYESAGSKIDFVVYDFDQIADRDNDPRLSVREIELQEGFSEVITDNSGYYVDADISELDTSVATLTMTGQEVTTNAAQVLGTGSNIDLDSCQYTFTAIEGGYYEVSATTLDGETVYLNHFSTTNSNIPNITTPGKIAVQTSSYTDMFKLVAQNIDGSANPARSLHFHTEQSTPYWNRCGNDTSVKCHEYLYRKAAADETASTEIPGYVRITGLEEIVDGGKYLIAAQNEAGSWYVLNPSTSTDKWGHVAQIAGSTTVGWTELTFTGTGKGYTEVVVGSTIYKLTVHGANDIYLDVGESVTVTDDTGYYVDADLSMLDTAVATVELTGEITGYDKLLSANVSEITSGSSYVLYNKAARKLMSNEWADASVGGGGSDGLSLDSTVNSFQDNDIWTITAAEGGWYVQDLNGKYLSIARGKGLVKDEPVVIDLGFDGNDWTIGENGEYANDFGGAHTAVAGWSDINDVNSQWEIYQVSQVALGTTTITFTGVGEGVTSVQIGNELYEITVTEPYVDPADDSRDIPLNVLNVSTGDYETDGGASEGPAYLAVDDNPNTLWHTDWYGTSRENHWFQFELTDSYAVDGLRYWPRQAGNTNGTITEYEIQVSDDGENFRTVASGEWENDRNWKIARFPGENVKYVRLVAVDAVTDNQYVFASASEIRITGVKTDAPPHEHQYEAVVTAPTCTEGGYTTYTCSCGDSYTADETPALGHDYVAQIVEPTCTKSGYTLYTCSRCGHSYKDDPVEPEHKFDEGTVTAPTCTEQGYTTYTCQVCGFEYVDEASWTPALGHTSGEPVKENEKPATCTEDGSYELVTYCTVCGEVVSRETVTVAALGHTEEIIPGKAPTCTEPGLTEGKKCSVCGEILVAQVEIAALGHIEEVIPAVEPTCTETGLTEGKKCSVCDEILVPQEEIPALGHEWKGTGCTRCDEKRENPFVDVPEDSFYIDPVLWAVEKGITKGVDDTHFNPNGVCQRASVVTFLWRAAGSPEPETANNPFTDVKESDFFYKAVLWAVENEITKGMSDTTFGPYIECNRAQVVTFLWRAMGEPAPADTENPFSDVNVSEWYGPAVLWAVENDITNGMGDGTFGINTTCNRAQVVTFLYRTYVK